MTIERTIKPLTQKEWAELFKGVGAGTVVWVSCSPVDESEDLYDHLEAL